LFARAWAAQWEAADSALELVRRRELAAMTVAEGLAASEALLELAAPTGLPKSRLEGSGLVEQQRLLGCLRRAG
jgi:hypothetical protein